MGASTNDSNNMISRGKHGSIVCFSTTRFTFSRLVLSVLKRTFKWCRSQSNSSAGSAKRGKSNDTDPSKSPSPANSPTDQTLALASGRDAEVPFNVGLGFGLMYLIVACKNEFDKMTELRTQMALLAQDVRNDIHRKKETTSTSKPSQTNANLSFSSTRSFHNNQKYSSIDFNKNLEYNSAETEEELAMGVDQIEAELEFEFERLQLINSNTEMPVVNHSDDVGASDDDDELIEIDKNEGEDAIYTCNYEGGVCPKELERRLHKVLETRQQERIAELEYALECAEKRLHQKEMEASWWKDTARLISQHINSKSEYLTG